MNRYEAHITIEPVFGDDFLLFDAISTHYRFRPAELLLMKRRDATPQRSSKDSFCTGHGTDYDELLGRTLALVEELKDTGGFSVWRYKIENIVLDVRTPPLIQIQHATV